MAGAAHPESSRTKSYGFLCSFLQSPCPHIIPILSFFFFSFIDYFLCRSFLNSVLNLLQHCFCFMFWFFGPKACGMLASPPGMEPAPSVLEGKVLTTRPPGKSSQPFSCVLLQHPHLSTYTQFSLISSSHSSQRDCLPFSNI